MNGAHSSIGSHVRLQHTSAVGWAIKLFSHREISNTVIRRNEVRGFKGKKLVLQVGNSSLDNRTEKGILRFPFSSTHTLLQSAGAELLGRGCAFKDVGFLSSVHFQSAASEESLSYDKLQSY